MTPPPPIAHSRAVVRFLAGRPPASARRRWRMGGALFASHVLPKSFPGSSLSWKWPSLLLIQAVSWDNAGSSPVHAVGENPAVPVFDVVQRLLVHEALHALQQRNVGAFLDREALHLAIALDALGVVRHIEESHHLVAHLRPLPGGER